MRITSTDQLGDLVRTRRKRRKMSQAELASKTGGVSRQWIVSIEAGKANPDLETLLRLTDALGLNLDIGRGDEVRLSVGTPDLDDVLDRLKK